MSMSSLHVQRINVLSYHECITERGPANIVLDVMKQNIGKENKLTN